MSSVTTRIEPLGKDNFDTWKLQVEALLIKNDNWKFVSGGKKCPAGELTDAAVKTWVDDDKKARSDLILAINPSELKQIKNCSTSHEVWKKLHSIYESKGPARKATLLKKLILCKMTDGMDVRAHITDFFDAIDKLKDMDIEINDDLLSIMLLYSLPETFENFRCAIESRDAVPNPECLKVKIIEEYDARKSKDHDYSSNAMFVKRSVETRRGPNRENNRHTQKQYFPFQCHRCRMVGHKAIDCKKPQKKGEGNGNNGSPKACVGIEKDSEEEFALAQLNPTGNRNWCLDSGCTSHMTSRKSAFHNLNKIEKELNLANGNSTAIEGIGEIKIHANRGVILNLEKVMFVPELKTNLLSVSKITDKGLEVKFTKQKAEICTRSGNTIAVANREGDLYYVCGENKSGTENANTVVTNCESELEMKTWHEKLSHLNTDYIREMLKKNKVTGLKMEDSVKSINCEICIQAKQSQLPFKTVDNEPRTSELLEIVYSDICGPMRQESVGGARYFITFIDDKSRWCEVRFLKRKSDAFLAFKSFKSYAELETGKKIKCIQSDNGLEYVNRAFDEFLAENGIKRRLTTPHTPQQNGVAERKNRTLVEAARSMMLQAKMSPGFWAEAVNTGNYTRNRCISKSIQGEVPYYLWKGRKPAINHLQVFGTKAFVLKKGQNLGKFESKSSECIFVGYSDESKGYRLWSPEKRKIIISRDVKFTPTFSEDMTYEEIYTDDTTTGDVEITLHRAENENSRQTTTLVETNEEIFTRKEPQKPRKVKRGRPRLLRTGRKGRPKRIFERSQSTPDPQEDQENPISESEYESANFAFYGDPSSLQEALSVPEASEWRRAIQSEFLAHVKNETWEIVNRPTNVNVVGCRFVFSTKIREDNTIERRKARLVARGFSQRRGIDYQETFAPVIRMSSIRTLMAMAVENSWFIHQMDVVTAYLHGELTEIVYMELPDLLLESLEEIASGSGNNRTRTLCNDWLTKLTTGGQPKICLLKKSLYGLKQAGREWHKKLAKELEGCGMNRAFSDPCIFYQRTSDKIMIVCVYVDDLLLLSNCENWIHRTKRELMRNFEMKDLGKLRYCLGIEFCQSVDRRRIVMHQRKYAEDVLGKFGMQDCKTISTPLEPNLKLIRAESEAVERSRETYPYQNLVGSLMYLAVSTRPDLSFAVSCLSQFNNCYSTEHWAAAKRVLRYLRGTTTRGLVFRKTGQKLLGFADADWASSLEDRKSYTGYAFKLGGAAISWESRKQQTVALSTTEAEYMALTESSKEAIHLQRFLTELGDPVECITILNDNQGALLLAKNPAFHCRTKHIDIKHHFVREALENRKIEVRYLSTTEMTADILTKGLLKIKHEKFVRELGLEDC